jgi:hypothetical protein
MNVAQFPRRETAVLHSAKMAVRGGSISPLPDVVERAFAPLHKRALGTAVGLTAALAVFLVTAFHILVAGERGVPIGLLAQYFYGYNITWPGALIGMWWGFVAGFAAGWFVAFLRNLALATWVFRVRTRAELNQTSDFLDHI